MATPDIIQPTTIRQIRTLIQPAQTDILWRSPGTTITQIPSECRHRNIYHKILKSPKIGKGLKGHLYFMLIRETMTIGVKPFACQASLVVFKLLFGLEIRNLYTFGMDSSSNRKCWRLQRVLSFTFCHVHENVF